MVDIPIINPEDMSYTEISEFSEDIKKEEKRRKKVEKEYIFNDADIKELNQRLANGEDIEDITISISEKGIISQQTLPEKRPTQPIIQIQPPLLPPFPTEDREKKKAKKILRSEAQRIDHPEGECCSSVCKVMNDTIDGYTGIVSPNQDTKLKFNTLVELRRQFYLQDACQCANGHYAQRYDIPLKEKQNEDCCPKVCEVMNNTIDEYDSILLPTHSIRITSDALYDMRAKIYKNGGCKCVENEELLKKQPRGGPPIDPLVQIKLGKLLKFAESQGWIK